MAKQHAPRFLELATEVRKGITECTVHDLKKRMDCGPKPVVIDVREESEFAAGHLPGAIPLGKGIIERDIEGLFPNPTTELFLYCGGGFRSALAAANLKKMGYTNVISVDGGWRGWNDAGYPIDEA